MPTIDNQKFYLNAIKKHGYSARGLNWNSENNQIVRFKQLTKLLPKDLENFTLTDVGCGFGDFYLYLEQKPKKYLGVDILEEMTMIAQINTAQEVQQCDVLKESLTPSDYVVCSGALNILTRFETTLFIQNCYKASKHGFIFNCLYGDRESETFNYLNSKFIEDIALSLGVNEVKYIENYIPNDITVGFFR